MDGGNGHWRPRRISLAIFVLAPVFGLVSDLATNIVQVSWPWWPAVVWTVVGLLLLALGILEAARYRPKGDTPPQDNTVPDARVFGAIPQRAWHWQNRPVEAALLKDALGSEGRAALVALPGARGAGKSQLAAELARRCVADCYDLVAWFNAESGPVTGLALLAERLGLDGGREQTPEVMAAAACQWLQRDDHVRRLVIFDNVDDPDSLTGFLPVTGSTKVIVTSNRQEFTSMAGVSPVPVGMFTPGQGQAFLRQATGLSACCDALTLGEQLGWLPLGLAQAAAYIVHSRLSYRQYLVALDEQGLDETLRRHAGTDHPGVLKATQLSLAGVRRADPSGDATRLLTMLSLLSPDGFSRALLTRAEPTLGLRGRLGPALHTLATASLITLNGPAQDAHYQDTVVVSVHRLTARVIRHQAGRPPTTLAKAANTTARVLDGLIEAFPLEQVARRRGELDELVGHILTLRGHGLGSLLAQSEWAGMALREAGDLRRAIPVLEHAVAERLRTLGPDHPETLESRHNLAVAYRSAGRINEAIQLHHTTLRDYERVLGLDHRDTLESRHNLANAYWSAGHLNEAIALHQETLNHRERVLGLDHPDTLRSRNNLAITHWSAGRLNEAIALFKATLADDKRVLGPDHPDTLRSRNNLGYAYWSAGRLTEAIAFHETNLADYERVLGPDHPDTLLSRNNLAMAYQSAGRIDEAIHLHLETLTRRESVLGPDHPHTLLSRNNLAVAYQSAGRLVDAIALHQVTLADYERVLGLDHPDTLDCRNNLAIAYHCAGQIDQAIVLHREALAHRERVLGPDHPDTLDSRNNLASAYQSAGRLAEAVALFVRVLNDCERVLDTGHPLTTTVRENLACARRSHPGWQATG